MIGQTNRLFKTITSDQANCFCKWNVSGDENDAKVRGDKAHRVIINARQVGEKLGVAGKAVTAQEERALVDWRRGNRVDLSRGAKFHRRLDVPGGSFARSPRLDARFDVALNVIQMEDQGCANLSGQTLVAANDL